jgi:aspartate kinase
VKISGFLLEGKIAEAEEVVNEVEKKYISIVEELYSSKEFKEKGYVHIKNFLDILKSNVTSVRSNPSSFTNLSRYSIISQGELISSALFHTYLLELHLGAILIPALNFMRTDKDGEPDYYYIKEMVGRELIKYV